MNVTLHSPHSTTKASGRSVVNERPNARRFLSQPGLLEMLRCGGPLAEDYLPMTPRALARMLAHPDFQTRLRGLKAIGEMPTWSIPSQQSRSAALKYIALNHGDTASAVAAVAELSWINDLEPVAIDSKTAAVGLAAVKKVADTLKDISDTHFYGSTALYMQDVGLSHDAFDALEQIAATAHRGEVKRAARRALTSKS